MRNESYYHHGKLNENQSSIFKRFNKNSNTKVAADPKTTQSLAGTTIYKNDLNLIVFRKFSDACV